MATEKTAEETKKKISKAMQKAWKKRKLKSKGLIVPLSSNGSILSTIDQTTEALRKLTLENIGSLAGSKGVESKVDALLKLVTNLKQVVKSSSSRKR